MDLWPLFGLEVSTPRVTLRYVTDDLAFQLARLAADGVHDPAVMPFSTPWTDVEPPELQRNALRHFWENRGKLKPEHWSLNFAICEGPKVLGTCVIDADDFPTKHSAETGSWVGLRHQGQGIGTETRRAALSLIFDGLDARTATTAVWHDNHASLGVTAKFGYRQTRKSRPKRRGKPDTMLHFEMTREEWRRPHDIQLTGIEAVREFLGVVSAG